MHRESKDKYTNILNNLNILTLVFLKCYDLFVLPFVSTL